MLVGRNAHMDLGSPSGSDHGDDFFGGGATDNGVIHQDHPLPFNVSPVGIMLQPDAQVANLIRGLNKSASNIMIADNAELKAAGPLHLQSQWQRERLSLAPALRCPLRPCSPLPVPCRCVS